MTKKHWAALDFPRHIYHYSLKSLQVLSQRERLSIRRFRYLPVWPVMAASLSSNKILNNQITSVFDNPIWGILMKLLRKGENISIELVPKNVN